MNTTELKKTMIKHLDNLEGDLYYHKFLRFSYSSNQVKEIEKDIENIKNKIQNLKENKQLTKN
jgi:hypothetical protein|tara:strand:- start:30 stop:218 length:189 start_codon:yes stop_codon:yes gene_type:complete